MVFTKLSYYLLISLVISCTSWSVKRPNNCMTLKLPSSGENMGPAKLEKAAKLGVKIINEDAFLNMLE